MTLIQKSILALVGVIVLVGAYGGYRYLFAPAVQPVVSTSTQGSTENTSRRATIAVLLAAPGANATSSTILNASPNDYYVNSLDVGCEKIGTSQTAYTGAGLASLTATFATSSTAAPSAIPSSNSIGVLTVATSSAFWGVSSSTLSGPNGVTGSTNIWASGSYLTITFNATNTASCEVGVGYFSS